MFNSTRSVALRTCAFATTLALLSPSAAWALQSAPAAPAAPPPNAPATPAAPQGASPAAPPSTTPAPKARPKAPTIVPVETTEEKPTASAIFAKHVAATGGDAAWSAKTSMRSTGSMRVPAIGIDAPMTIKGMDPAFVDVTIELPQQGTTRVGYDGTIAWSMDPMRGPMLLQPTEIADLTSRADFRRDLKLAKDAGKAEVVGLAQFNGRKVWQVRLAEGDAPATINLYDEESGLLVGSTMVSRTQMGEIPVTVVMDEYKDFDGVKLPAKTVLWMMMQSQEILTSTVEWNALTAADFTLPQEIQALVKARDAPPTKESSNDGANTPDASAPGTNAPGSKAPGTKAPASGSPARTAPAADPAGGAGGKAPTPPKGA